MKTPIEVRVSPDGKQLAYRFAPDAWWKVVEEWSLTEMRADDVDVKDWIALGPAVHPRAMERLEATFNQAVEDWGRNDEAMLAENQRLADEVERLRTTCTNCSVGGAA